MTDLRTTLAQLESAHLVRRIGEDEATYIFKHGLTLDTAYASLLKTARREIHRHVAQSLEVVYAERIDEFAALLTFHYIQAGDDDKTLDYATRAGNAAARVYANAEAVTFYTHAIEAARRIGANADGFKELYLKRGRELELASQFSSALDNYAEMENLARERNDPALELGALVAQCQLRCTANAEFNPALGEPLAEHALQLARALQDRATESKILWILVNLYRLTGRFAPARAAGEASIKIARELNLREQLAYSLNDLSHVYTFGVNFKRARELIQEATQIWRELGNLPMLADSLATASLDNSFAGDFDETLALSDQAYQVSRSIGNLWGQTYSLSTVGIVHWMRGETARAIRVMEETLRLSEQSGYSIPQLMTRADLGITLASLGACERGMAHARAALDFADAHFVGLRPYVLGALMQIYLGMGDYAQAETTLALFRESDTSNPLLLMYNTLATARFAGAQKDPARTLDLFTQLINQLNEFGIRTQLPEAFYHKGLAEYALGQHKVAHASLTQALAHAQALQARWQWWQILDALGEIESARGNASQAQKLYGEARELIIFIADHAPPELRDSFLALPRVRKVKEEHDVEK